MDRSYTIDDATPSRLPKFVEKLVESNKLQITNSLDLLSVILHCLMIEVGFCDEENKDNSSIDETSQSDINICSSDIDKTSQNVVEICESNIVDKNVFKFCDKSSNVYRFKYFLDRDPEKRKCCVLVVTAVGPVITAIGKCQKQDRQ